MSITDVREECDGSPEVVDDDEDVIHSQKCHVRSLDENQPGTAKTLGRT
jgi:hypothetical protein